MLRKASFLILLLILLPCISYAEIKTFTHTVKQPFGGSQSPDDARIAAIAKAKREVLEIAGTYLETMTVVKEHEVESDDILALAAGVLKAEIVSQKNYASEDAFGIIIETKVDVDTSILDERVKALLQDRSLLDRYKADQKHKKELLDRIEELERENRKLISLSPEKQKQKKETLRNQFKLSSQSLSASELNEKALALVKEGKYTDPDGALEYLNKAIELNPKYAVAYVSRGFLWFIMNNYYQACKDVQKGCELGNCFGLKELRKDGYCK